MVRQQSAGFVLTVIRDRGLRTIVCGLVLLAFHRGDVLAQRPGPAAADVVTRATELMRTLVAGDLFQGAVVIARGNRVVYAAGFGLAERERRVPFAPGTPMDAASIAKTFTAAGLLLLSSEGRVDLDAKVRAIIPTFPHPSTRVRHLLTHAAGLPEYEWFDQRVSAREPRTNASHLAVMAKDAPTPNFAPGTAFAYDNVAYDVAAMVIERVTGTSFAEFIANRFARPLGLKAFVRPARFAEWPGVRTRGYRRTAAGWEANDAYDLEGFYGADNIYLSATDLQRWVAGYRRLMGPARMRESMTPGRLDDGRTTGITIGSWYASPDGSRRYYSGHHNGFHSVAYADDARDLSVVWVANDTPPTWLHTGLSRALIAIAEGRTPQPLVPPLAGDSALDAAGRYRHLAIGDVEVRRDGGRLRVRRGGVEYDAFGVEPGVHYVPGLDAYLRFRVARDGVVSLFWDSIFAVVPSIPRERVLRR